MISRAEGKSTTGKVCHALDLKCPVKLLRGDGTFKGWDLRGRSWLSECTRSPLLSVSLLSGYRSPLSSGPTSLYSNTEYCPSPGGTQPNHH